MIETKIINSLNLQKKMCDYILIISFCFLIEKNTYFSHKKKE